jgi:hypothetical protein
LDFLDSGFRRNDELRLNQNFLKPDGIEVARQSRAPLDVKDAKDIIEEAISCFRSRGRRVYVRDDLTGTRRRTAIAMN